MACHKKTRRIGRVFCTDGVGFEPTEGISPRRFSRPLHSTALPPILELAGHSGRAEVILACFVGGGKCFLLHRAKKGLFVQKNTF